MAHATGKRKQEIADRLIKKIKERGKPPSKDNKADFASDGNDQYTKGILKYFDEKTVNYGQLIKERKGGRVVKKTRAIVFGSMDEKDMETVYIERYNLTLRNGISCLIRKTICFSKSTDMFDNYLDVYQCYNNMVRVNSALTIKTKKGEKNIERTPCMVERITDPVWTWKELLMFKVLPTIY